MEGEVGFIFIGKVMPEVVEEKKMVLTSVFLYIDG